jgi:hypothetical protein
MQTLLSGRMRIKQRSRRVILFVSLFPLLSACAGLPKAPLTAADQADIDRVTGYLNGILRFTAHFVQYGSFGPDSGLISLDRRPTIYASTMTMPFGTSARVTPRQHGQWSA